MSAPSVTCASCRRSVIPQRGDLGPSCPRCGAFLPRAELPRPRKPLASPEPLSRADVAGEVAERLLEEAGAGARSVAEFAAFHAAATDLIAEAAEQDERLAERRENARYWRERMPDLIELFG